MQNIDELNFEIMVDKGRFKSTLGELFFSFYQEQIASLLCQFFKDEPRKIEIYFIESFGFSRETDLHACHSDSIKVFFIFNLTKNTIPLLKYADLIFFFNSPQERLYRKLCKFIKPNKIIDLKTAAVNDAEKKNELLLFFSWHYKPFEYFKLIKEVRGRLEHYQSKNLDRINFVFQFPLARKDKIVNSVKEFISCAEVCLFDSSSRGEQIEAAFRSSRYGEVFEENLISDPVSSIYTLDSKVERLSLDYNLSSNIAENLMARCGVQIANQTLIDISTDELVSFNTAIQTLNVVSKGWPDLDNYDDLHILHGSTLSNQYVISIFFRNIGDKLQRCIYKLISCAKDYDVGIVLVDDASDDNALERMLSFLKKSGFDCVIIKNRVRKFSARNYYNVIHNIVANDSSIIIDIDGCDYLNDSIDVFGILDQAYSDGLTLKTIGSFITTIEEYGETDEATLKRKMYLKILKEHRLLNDFNDPWNQFRAQTWMQLRTGKRELLKKIEIDYYLERDNKAWLQSGYESIINSRAIELSNGKAKFINEPLYIYDIFNGGDDFPFPQGLDSCESDYTLYRAYIFDNVDRNALC